MNRVVLQGKVKNNPTSYSGESWRKASFILETKGEKSEYPSRHIIVAWNERADMVMRYVCNGMNLMVIGNQRTRKYKNREGVEQYVTEVKIYQAYECRPLGEEEEEGLPPVDLADRQEDRADFTEFGVPAQTDEECPF